jgi:hypothetical protein
MKDLQIRYSHDNDVLVETFEIYLRGILTGDIAMAEPSSANLPWWMVGLIVTVSEAYFDNSLVDDKVIMGIACPEQGMIQVFTQDYVLDDPQAGLLALAELQDTTDYVGIYVRV